MRHNANRTQWKPSNCIALWLLCYLCSITIGGQQEPAPTHPSFSISNPKLPSSLEELSLFFIFYFEHFFFPQTWKKVILLVSLSWQQLFSYFSFGWPEGILVFFIIVFCCTVSRVWGTFGSHTDGFVCFLKHTDNNFVSSSCSKIFAFKDVTLFIWSSHHKDTVVYNTPFTGTITLTRNHFQLMFQILFYGFCHMTHTTTSFFERFLFVSAVRPYVTQFPSQCPDPYLRTGGQ